MCTSRRRTASTGRSHSRPSPTEANAHRVPRRLAGRAPGLTAGPRGSRSAPARSQRADRGRRCPGESGRTGRPAAARAPRPQRVRTCGGGRAGAARRARGVLRGRAESRAGQVCSQRSGGKADSCGNGDTGGKAGVREEAALLFLKATHIHKDRALKVCALTGNCTYCKKKKLSTHPRCVGKDREAIFKAQCSAACLPPVGRRGKRPLRKLASASAGPTPAQLPSRTAARMEAGNPSRRAGTV